MGWDIKKKKKATVNLNEMLLDALVSSLGGFQLQLGTADWLLQYRMPSMLAYVLFLSFASIGQGTSPLECATCLRFSNDVKEVILLLVYRKLFIGKSTCTTFAVRTQAVS